MFGSLEEEEDKRTCWVCFATDEDEPSASWLRPCRCKGTAKWVHNVCLQRWVDEKQHGNPTVRVFCPQCNTEYTIKYPGLNALLVIIDSFDTVVNKISPVMAAGVVVGSLYWSAVTFGAVCVMQVMGHKHGLEIMERADPIFLLVGLPTIPLGLILGKMIRWEDYILQLWREHSSKWWILTKLFGSSDSRRVDVRVPLGTNTQMDFISSTRILCGALALPTFATACGNYLFSKVENPIRRTVLGGATFIFLKGLVQMYYKQQQYVRLARRTVENYVETHASSL